MDTFPGQRALAGYDVAYELITTLDNSSLGAKFKQLGWRLCVNAFHGYAHNYTCQVQHHPNVVLGMGLEDLETLERIFSFSNQLASVTRHTSAFHRRVYIDMMFAQWDEDKYRNLGTMILNNYKQALQIVDLEGTAQAEAMQSLNIAHGDIERWLVEEKHYVLNLGNEPEWDIHAVAYVELLQQLRELE